MEKSLLNKWLAMWVIKLIHLKQKLTLITMFYITVRPFNKAGKLLQ